MDDKIYKTIVSKVTDAVVVANFQGDILYWNDSAKSIFGYSQDEVLGKYVHDILPVHDLRERADDSFRKFQQNGGQGPLIGKGIHVKGLTKYGEEVHVHFSPNVVKIDGETIVFAFIRDITEFIVLQEKLRLQSVTDELTGIFNRRAFYEISQKAFVHAQRHDEPFSLLLFDIDHFKSVNDTYGHHVGDQVIREFASYINSNTREDDIFGRVGGEEFYLALPKADVNQATVIAEKIRFGIEHLSICADELILNITSSIGIASITEKDNFDNMQQRSDKALYKAKNAGRNQIGIEPDFG